MKNDKSIHLAVKKLLIIPIFGGVIVIRDQCLPKSIAQSTAQLPFSILHHMELYHSTDSVLSNVEC